MRKTASDGREIEKMKTNFIQLSKLRPPSIWFTVFVQLPTKRFNAFPSAGRSGLRFAGHTCVARPKPLFCAIAVTAHMYDLYNYIGESLEWLFRASLSSKQRFEIIGVLSSTFDRVTDDVHELYFRLSLF